MAQNPLPPPPPSGGVLDGWLYMLWRRLTQAGQILWESITPGTSADVAAAVTDETGSPGSLVFSNNPTFESLNVASGGKVLVGVATDFDISPSGSGQYPVIGSFSASSSFPFVSGYFGNDANSANWTALKSRSGTPGTHGVVSSGDQVGGFLFRGDDGTYFRNCASIYALVDGTTASNQMPGRLIFQVSPAGAAATMAEKMRISSDGSITLGGTSTASALKVIPDATPSTQRRVEITAGSSTGNPKLNTSAGSLELGSTGTTAMTIDSSGNVTVGVSPPTFTTPFTVYASGGTSAGMVGIGDGTGAQMVAIRVSNDANQPQLIVQKRRGSWASPSAVASADALGDVVFQGYGGTNTRTLAYIRANVDTYTSDSDISAYLRFAVSPAGSAAAVEALRITSAKRVVATATIATGGYTVATLPTGTVGDRAYVTDALAPAYGVAVAGGGAVTIPVFYNGAAWICA